MAEWYTHPVPWQGGEADSFAALRNDNEKELAAQGSVPHLKIEMWGTRHRAAPAAQLFLAEEEGFDFEPVADAGVAGDGGVVGRVVEDAFAGEAAQLAGVVVDEVVGAEDGFVAAEDDVRRGDEGEVLVQPTVFSVEGGGHLHGGAGDKDLVVPLQLLEHALRVGHDVERVEEVGGVQVFV